MDELLKSFKIGFLLRSFFSGVFFVFSYCIATNGYHFPPDKLFPEGLGYALIAGVTIYGVHRSLLYPLIEWPLFCNWAKKVRATERKLLGTKTHFRWTLINQTTIDDVVRRWDAKSNPKSCKKYRAEQITLWADYIHLQYTSAWCIAGGALIAVITSGKPPPPNCPLVALGVFFFAIATISNWRALSVEEHCNKEYSAQ